MTGIMIGRNDRIFREDRHGLIGYDQLHHIFEAGCNGLCLPTPFVIGEDFRIFF